MISTKIILLTVTLASIHGTLGCLKKFDNEKSIHDARDTCMEQLGIPTENSPNYQNYATEGFQDQCLAQCVLKKLELLDEAGNLDRDGAFDLVEEHAPKQLINKLAEIMSKCTESTGVSKIEGSDKCKPLATFYGCFAVSADKLC